MSRAQRRYHWRDCPSRPDDPRGKITGGKTFAASPRPGRRPQRILAGPVRPTHIEGAPALVVETISPSPSSQDRLRKMNLCARFEELRLATAGRPMIQNLASDFPPQAGNERPAPRYQPA